MQLAQMQQTIHAGAFEALGISGVAVAVGAHVVGIRLAAPHPMLGLYDGKDVLLSLEPPFDTDPELRYVRYRWHVPITPVGIRKVVCQPRLTGNSPIRFDFAPGETVCVQLEWRRHGTSVIGRYTADGPLSVGLLANGAVAPAVVQMADARTGILSQGECIFHLRLSGDTHSPWCLTDYQQAMPVWEGKAATYGDALVLYPAQLRPETPLYFALTVEHDCTEQPTPLTAECTHEIDRLLQEGADTYAQSRMQSDGLFAGSASAISGLTGYGRTYDPHQQREAMIVNRTWATPNTYGPIFGWDNFFNAYLAAWENPAVAASTLEHIVNVYAKDGIAHGPTQRNLIIPTVYARTIAVLGDDDLAHRTWPTMMAFMRFWFADRGDGRPWRDGNGDGLIEPGTSEDPSTTGEALLAQACMDETGYDDFPLYSFGLTDGRVGLLAPEVAFDRESRMLTVTLLCQNSLYCASCKAMAEVADSLGYTEDARWLRAEAVRIAARIRGHLYNKADGLFRDRYWNGEFASFTGMTIFYPLLAGIADPTVQERLKALLLDPAHFWGENLLPTVSRSDPHYCDGLDRRGNYWRGNCWPPTTYIVYLAIKEAGWNDIAAEYARRAQAMFMEYWQAYGHAYENYPPDGKVDYSYYYPCLFGGREPRYLWSALLPLCGLEELFAPETTSPGVRFGNPHLAAEASWEGFMFQGERMRAVAGPQITSVTCGERWAFHAEPGVVVRRFQVQPTSITCRIHAATEVIVRLYLPNFPDDVTAAANGRQLPIRRECEWLEYTLTPGEHTLKVAAMGQ